MAVRKGTGAFNVFKSVLRSSESDSQLLILKTDIFFLKLLRTSVNFQAVLIYNDRKSGLSKYQDNVYLTGPGRTVLFPAISACVFARTDLTRSVNDILFDA